VQIKSRSIYFTFGIINFLLLLLLLLFLYKLIQTRSQIIKKPSGPISGHVIDYNKGKAKKYLESIKDNLTLNPNDWDFKSDDNYRYVLEGLDKK